ncbi:hypothetical protein SG34_001595 [Thalassomonas viridans]|uniref:Orphan protein n=2 Tax=Thalassomonas viridans TaxID=137584 RepID=A0AAE9Z7S7_9GAMM|nr:hypothetical protein SG34_001595 [Thalassomonas viridans]
MPLSDNEAIIYQNALKQVSDISLNLMAVKVDNHPGEFNLWCRELAEICLYKVNRDLMDEHQFKPLNKLIDLMKLGAGVSQLRMSCIAPWPFYAGFLQEQAEIHALEERSRLLTFIEKIKATPLAEMINEDRLAYAGKHTSGHDTAVYNFDVEWFGGTKGAKAFHNVLAQYPELLDTALAHIPLTGEVSKSDYQAFVRDYKTAFDKIGEKATLAPATRLLAMRRPDQFVVLTSGKIDSLCQGIGIPRLSNQSFDDYFTALIGSVRNMAWWRQEAPEDEQELFLWQHRAILMDMLFYADAQTAENSNYLKLLNKPVKAKAAKSSASGSGGGRRSKDTAAMLVDRALAAEDIPEHILAKRDSIVAEVEKGKKVEDVLNLMRMIFG